MIRRKRHCFLLFCFLFHVFAEAQYYNLNFRNYSSHNGISQSEVVSVFQDKQGFLWIGTRFGLTRYDGRDFRVFFHEIEDPFSLGGNNVVAMDEDSRGQVWFALYNSGICSLNRLNLRFQNWFPDKKDNSSLSNSRVNDILVDKQDRIWIGTELGLSIFDQQKKTFRNIPSLPGDTSPTWINSLDKDAFGNIYIGTYKKGLYRADSSLKIEKLFSAAELHNIHKTFIGTDGKAWIGTDSGIFSFPVSEGHPVNRLERNPFIPSRFVIKDIEIDDKGNFWLATNSNGLLIYFPATRYLDEIKENVTSARGLLSNRLIDLYQDNSGGMWVAGENGVQSFHDAAQKFFNYPSLSITSEKLRGSSIYGIEEIDNDLLIATSGGVLVFNRLANKFLRVDIQHELKDVSIRFRTLQREKENTWWICSDYGIFELVRKTGYYILRRPAVLEGLPLLRTLSLRNYIRTHDGKMWIAATDSGIICYDPAKRKLERFKHDPANQASIANNNINIIAFDRDSNILAGHDGGMSILKKGAKGFINIPYEDRITSNKLSSRYIYDFYDSGNYYWIATFGGGLNQLNKKDYTTKFYTTRQGLCSDAIYTIVPEGDSLLWLATNKGISRFSLRDRVFENFGINDGMPADEFNMSSRYRNEGGEIFMGTINGLISFIPKNLSTSQIRPKVYLSRARLSGKILEDSLTAVLNRDRLMTIQYGNDLYLEFSPMIYYGGKNMVVKYQVPELSDQWKTGEVGNLLPLVKMEAGNYKINVKISDSQNKVESDTWQFFLVVTPPFWQTLGFRLAVVLLGLLAGILFVGGYIRSRLQKQRVVFERQQAVEKERARISAELHDDIGGGLTAIRLLSEMNKEQSRDERSRVFFEKISNSSNELIQKMNEIVWTLNVNNDNLQSLISYTRQYAVSYLDDLQIRCQVELPEQIPDIIITGHNRRMVFLLVKETLNNIAKHAQATAVNILITIGERLMIEVRDNGMGFDLASVRFGANGLINMQKRIDYLEGRMNIKSQQGTSVMFDIPLERLSN